MSLQPVSVKNNATDVVVATSSTNSAGRWDHDLADETVAYKVEIGGAGGATQRVVQAPASIELEWLFVRYGAKAHTGAALDFASAASVTLPSNTTIGGQSVNQAALDTRYVNIAGDTMTGALTVAAQGSRFGTAGGPSATTPVASTDANLLLYNFGSGNWAGLGADGSGNVWLRAGLTGSPVPYFVVTSSGQLIVPVGTAALPSLTFQGDTNTGIYRSAEGAVTVASNGVVAFTVQPSSVAVTQALVVGGLASLNGGVAVTGASTLNGVVSANSLNVATNAAVSGLLTVSNLTVNGATTLTGTTTAGAITAGAITASGVLDLPTGSAGTPAIRFGGNLYTGIYSEYTGGDVSISVLNDPTLRAYADRLDVWGYLTVRTTETIYPAFAVRGGGDVMLLGVDENGTLLVSASKVLGSSGSTFQNLWGAAPIADRRRIRVNDESGSIMGYIPLYN
jgi:hypothetical protein